MKKLLFFILTSIMMTSKINAQKQGKSALVLFETQNEWMHLEGKLRKAKVKDEQMMLNSIANIEKALVFARKNNIPVIHVGLRFEKGYPELPMVKAVCVKPSQMWELFR